MNRRATRSDALSGGDFAVSIVLHGHRRATFFRIRDCDIRPGWLFRCSLQKAGGVNRGNQRHAPGSYVGGEGGRVSCALVNGPISVHYGKCEERKKQASLLKASRRSP